MSLYGHFANFWSSSVGCTSNCFFPFSMQIVYIILIFPWLRMGAVKGMGASTLYLALFCMITKTPRHDTVTSVTELENSKSDSTKSSCSVSGSFSIFLEFYVLSFRYFEVPASCIIEFCFRILYVTKWGPELLLTLNINKRFILGEKNQLSCITLRGG